MKRISTFSLSLILLFLLAGCATPLQRAAEKGDIKELERLLAGGASPSEVAGIANITPLHYAAYYGQADFAALLIEKGADVNAKNTSRDTPLHSAVQGDKTNVVTLLLNQGADPGIRNLQGKTPLMIARENGNSAIVKMLSNAEERFLQRAEGPAVAYMPKPVIKETAIIDIHTIPDFKAGQRPSDLAIIIGIEQYQALPKSDYSKSDSKIVKGYLKALGFQERNIELLTDEKATYSSIAKTIEAWLPNRVKKESKVFIYYSGHGAPDPATGEAYLVPFDGDPNYLPVTGYPLKRLYERLGKLEAKEIIVVLDSCFSGAGGRSVLAQGARPLVMMTTTAVLSPNVAVLSATQGSQISTSSPEKGHGIFTYYFLKALKDGKKTLAEIYEYIKPQVEDEAKQINVQQSPSISPDVEKLKERFGLRR